MSEENLYTFENEAYRKTYWHTCSHVMAQAVKRLYPQVKLAIGPSIDSGWYYDFDADFSFTQEHLDAIEAEMKKICKEKLPLVRSEKPRAEAVAYMESLGEPYKVELINDLPEDAVISFYTQGEFTDLCAGPHLDSTGRIKANAFKLTQCCGAYWRGDSKRKMLQRIYGIASRRRRSWTNTCRSRRRPAGATTTSSAVSWNTSRPSTLSARACPSCCRRARASSRRCSAGSRTRRKARLSADEDAAAGQARAV